MSLVSVIIPNYNYARFVGFAIQSVLHQSMQDLELIVIDNGSTDHSREVLESIKDPRFKTIFHENRGQSEARNSGLRIATGDFIAFLDADDLWEKEKLAKQLALFSDPLVGLVYCGMDYVNAEGNKIGVKSVRPRFRGDCLQMFAEQAGAVVCGGESTAIVRASILKKAGVFDPRLSIGTGWDMWRRIAALSKIDYVDENLVHYRQHGNNLSRRLDVYAADTQLKLQKMFADMTSEKIAHLKSRAYGMQYLSLSGAHFQNYQFFSAVKWALRSLFFMPSSLIYILKTPARVWNRQSIKEHK